MKWNDDQQKAMEIRGSDILVAAGAGSGKTAVLVERIARRILPENGEKPLDIDRLVIVTFTKAAAAEMRQRLFDILRDRLENASGDEYRRIYTQQRKISKARISTIHSFCHSIINENVSESGIDSSFRLMSDSTPDKMKSDIADDVLEEMSLNDRDTYLRLTDIYGSWKSDDGLKKTVLDIVEFADNFADPVSKILEFADCYKAFPENDFAKSVWGIYLIKLLRNRFEDIINQFDVLRAKAVESGLDNCAASFEKDVNKLSEAVSVLHNDSAVWSDIAQISLRLNLDTFKSDRDSEEAIAISESLKKSRDTLKARIKELDGKYLTYSEDDFENEREAILPNVEAVSNAAIKVTEKYAALKKKRKLLDFSDLEHIALKLLSDDKIAGKYRNMFDEIYIDEYQDTNEVQNRILKLVSGGRDGVGNRFMVGDVKQSIYSFRQARPDIFTDKYNRYSDNTDGQLVRLNQNYRCRREVIDFTNNVFRKIMNRNTCEMDYGAAEELKCGAAPDYLPPHSDSYSYDYEIICAAGRNSDEAKAVEAQAVAAKIREIVSVGMLVGKTTEKADERRPVTYGDICILIRSPKNIIDTLMKTLEKNRIPAVFENSLNLYDCPEFMVVMSFLRVIDNPRQDIYLITVLKHIYGFTDELLAEIRLSAGGKDCDFYTAFDSSDKTECLYVRNRINDIRYRAQTMSVSEIVWNCMHENGFFDRLSLISGGDAARQNLMQLFGMAASSDGSEALSLGGFIERIDMLISMKGRLSGVPLRSGNSVRIMTVHGSKGLEFPVVFLYGCGAERNSLDEKMKFLSSRSLGFGTLVYDRDKKLCYPSVMKFLISDRRGRESRAEEMRILYVAMTRAREKLIVSGHLQKGISPSDYMEKIRDMSDGRGTISDYYINSVDRFIDLICAAELSDRAVSNHISFAEPEETASEGDGAAVPGASYATLPSVPLYSYDSYGSVIHLGRTADSEAPSKISVSEIRRLSNFAEDNDSFSAVPDISSLRISSVNDSSDGKLTAAKKGTLLHLAIEHMDFGKISSEGYAEELIMTLEDNGFITEEEAVQIPSRILSEFMKSGFAKRIAGADKVMREVPFTITESYGKFGIEKEGTCAVQGIIDCVFFENGRIILVDFKSDSVYDNYPEYSKKYSVQLEVYSEALRKAFGRYPDETYLYYLKNNHLEKM